MKKYLFVFAVFICLVQIPAYSEKNKMRIAVLDLKAEGIPASQARNISKMLRTDLINTDRFTIIERSQMDSILKEQGFQQTGCTDQECAVQLGKLMSAKKILVGEVSRFGNSVLVTVRVVDVEPGLRRNHHMASSEYE